MLKRFEVSNYKNFNERFTIDFSKVGGYQFSTDCITDAMISKMLIYGRNATGKTNLGKAILDVKANLGNYRSAVLNDGTYLNADSEKKFAEFQYTFYFDSQEVIYRYTKFSIFDLRDEELLIDEKRIFYYNFENGEHDFTNLMLIDADTAITERFLHAVKTEEGEEGLEQKLTFLRWIISNTAFVSNSLLLKLDNYVKRMTFLAANRSMLLRTERYYQVFYELLSRDNYLKEFEEFLNMMGVACKLVLKELPDGQRELYFKHSRLVPFFENLSSGTMALVNLYQMIIIGKSSSFLYVDEFDAFYHYEMSENVMKFFKHKYPDCQIILTTHNTNLMTNRLMRPDCLFILSKYGLTALCDATTRELREGHNLEKMYISGEFQEYE